MSLADARTRAQIARQGFDVIRATLHSPREAYHARAAILTYADCLAAYSDVVTAHSDAVVAQEASNKQRDKERWTAFTDANYDWEKVHAEEAATNWGLTAIIFASLGWAFGLLCGVGIL